MDNSLPKKVSFLLKIFVLNVNKSQEKINHRFVHIYKTFLIADENK